MSHLKLMKLLYLADRESMKCYGEPISFDCIVAMPHGPALSMTLNYMNGDIESERGGWNDYISDKEDYEISLKNEIETGDLDELSDADLEVLGSVWGQFGNMNRWEIRDYTHKNCPEWSDPNGSSFPIDYAKVFEALGYQKEQAEEFAESIRQEQNIEDMFASI